MSTSDPRQVDSAEAGREIDRRAKRYLKQGIVKTYSEAIQKISLEDMKLIKRYS